MHHAIERLIEAPQLRHPHVTVFFEELEVVLDIQRFHNGELRSELANVPGQHGIGFHLVSVRFIRDVNAETVQPALFLQVIPQCGQVNAVSLPRRRIADFEDRPARLPFFDAPDLRFHLPIISLPPGNRLAFDIGLPIAAARAGKVLHPRVEEREIESQLTVFQYDRLDEGWFERRPEHILPMRPHAVEQLIGTSPPVFATGRRVAVVHFPGAHCEPVGEQQVALKRDDCLVDVEHQWQRQLGLSRSHFDLTAIRTRLS